MARAYVCLIQSDYGRNRHGNLEASCTARNYGIGSATVSRNDFGPWMRGPRITVDRDNVVGPDCIIQSDYGTGIHKSFELAGMYGPSQLTALAFHGAAVRVQQ